MHWFVHTPKGTGKKEEFERAGFKYDRLGRSKNGRLAGWKLVGINPPPEDYAPPRQKQVKQVSAPSQEKVEKKPAPAPQPQKLPDPVVDGKETIKNFNQNDGKIWQQPDVTKDKGGVQSNTNDAVSMAQEAWTNAKTSDTDKDLSEGFWAKAKERSQMFQAKEGI